jgi:hypothetical protein
LTQIKAALSANHLCSRARNRPIAIGANRSNGSTRVVRRTNAKYVALALNSGDAELPFSVPDAGVSELTN